MPDQPDSLLQSGDWQGVWRGGVRLFISSLEILWTLSPMTPSKTNWWSTG